MDESRNYGRRLITHSESRPLRTNGCELNASGMLTKPIRYFRRGDKKGDAPTYACFGRVIQFGGPKR